MNKIQQIVLDAIDIKLEERLKRFNCDKTLRGKVVSIDGENCVVKINGEDVDCKIKDKISIAVDDIVNVIVNNNNFSDKYVDGKLGTIGTGGTGGDSSHTHSNLTILETITTTLINTWNTVANKVDKVTGKGLSTEDYTTAEKSKLNGIADNANNYSLPIATNTVLGGVKSGTDITVDTSGNVSVNDNSHNHTIANITNLQTTLDGKASSTHTHTITDITNLQTSLDNKMNNTKAAVEAVLTGVISSHSHSTGTPTAHASSHITSGTDIIPNAVANGNAGLFSGTDKSKLDGIADNANNYSHPSTHSASMITVTDTGNHFTATDVEGAMAELFTNVDSGKTNVYSAIVGKGQTPASTDFADLVTAIGNIVTGSSGAKYASGFVTSSSSGQANISVSGLTFSPIYVLYFMTISTSTMRKSFGILSSTAEISNWNTSQNYLFGVNVRDNSGTYTLLTETSNAITSSGFNASVYYNSRQYRWIAVAP